MANLILTASITAVLDKDTPEEMLGALGGAPATQGVKAVTALQPGQAAQDIPTDGLSITQISSLRSEIDDTDIVTTADSIITLNALNASKKRIIILSSPSRVTATVAAGQPKNRTWALWQEGEGIVGVEGVTISGASETAGPGTMLTIILTSPTAAIGILTGTAPAPVNTAPTFTQALTGTPTGPLAAQFSALAADTQDPESALIYTPSKVSGPGTVTPSATGTNAAKNFSATFDVAGEYVVRLTVTDTGSLTTTSDFTITVAAETPVNTAPSFTTPLAGTVTGPLAASFTSLATDAQDAENLLIYIPSRVSGPGTAVFSATGTNAAKNFSATFSAAGTYKIRQTVVDTGELNATSEFDVTVSAPAPAPEPAAALRVAFIDNSEKETGYRVRWSPDEGATWASANMPVSAGKGTLLQRDVTDLQWNTAYTVEIAALGRVGITHVTSAPLTGIMRTRPKDPPTAFGTTSVSTNAATVAWTLPAQEPLTGYRLRGYGEDALDLAPGTTEIDLEDLEPSTVYALTLHGYNASPPYPDAETLTAATLEFTTRAGLVAATIGAGGNTLTLEFSTAVTVGAGGEAALSLTATNGAVTAAYASGTGTKYRNYTLSRALTNLEDVTLDLTNPGNGLKEGVIDLLSFEDVDVINGSQIAEYILALDAEAGTNPGGLWTTSGSVNWGYTTVVLSGTKSIYVPSGGRADSPLLTPARRNLSLYCKFRKLTASTGDTRNVVSFHADDGTPLLQVRWDGSTVMHIESGTLDGQPTVKSADYTGLALNTTYHLWAEYEAGTEDEESGIARFYISTTGTKPGTPAGQILTSAAFLPAAQLRLGYAVSGSGHTVFDDVLLTTTIIGSNPVFPA